MLVSERARRVGENEALFRSVNEQVRELNRTFLVEGTMRIVCECGDQGCLEQIEVAPAAYERVRSDPTLFFVKPDHDVPEVETVVERNDTYWLVRKDAGTPSRLARETDPRT
jgi:hypothetical protein